MTTIDSLHVSNGFGVHHLYFKVPSQESKKKNALRAHGFSRPIDGIEGRPSTGPLRFSLVAIDLSIRLKSLHLSSNPYVSILVPLASNDTGTTVEQYFGVCDRRSYKHADDDVLVGIWRYMGLAEVCYLLY